MKNGVLRFLRKFRTLKKYWGFESLSFSSLYNFVPILNYFSLYKLNFEKFDYTIRFDADCPVIVEDKNVKDSQRPFVTKYFTCRYLTPHWMTHITIYCKDCILITSLINRWLTQHTRLNFSTLQSNNTWKITQFA